MAVTPAVAFAVPLAARIGITSDIAGPLPAAAGVPAPGLEAPTPHSPIPGQGLPPPKPCHLDFRGGCYAMTFRPTGGHVSYEGTLRVDRAAPDGGPDDIVVSGDLYTKPSVTGQSPPRPRIPVFARARYHSYLSITSVSVPAIAASGTACKVTLVAEQSNYVQPPAGAHTGSFPAEPSRTVTIVLAPAAAPFPCSPTGGPYYEGRLQEGGIDKGAVTLAWVSPSFRRATVEIDTLVGAVAPAPVPDGAGGTEYFDTIFAKTGWELTVVSDQADIPVPSGVTPTECWSKADLHALMMAVRNPATDLDAEWRVHLVVVPAKLGCSRGIMYDFTGVPREGCATFSDDGYPVAESPSFGSAQDRKQRDVPRAYLRSAAHEVTHALNQIHQEQETGADNSIMTSTPGVANVLGGPETGAPGVFPDHIDLAHNANVRHHLNHMPDPVIRPGGWGFSTWRSASVPQAADRHLFPPDELELTVQCAPGRLVLGQPVDLSWTLTNRSAVPLVAPSDVGTEALFATITVTDADGRARAVRPFVIVCDSAKLAALDPGKGVSATSRVFWSSSGFAFERPGRYRVTVAVDWSARGIPVGVVAYVDVFIEFPSSDVDNEAAGLVLHPEVGKWVALGGGAYHLPEATRRLERLSLMADGGVRTEALAALSDAGDVAPRLLKGFEGLLPSRDRLATVFPDLAGAPGGGGRDAARGLQGTRKRRRKPR